MNSVYLSTIQEAANNLYYEARLWYDNWQESEFTNIRLNARIIDMEREMEALRAELHDLSFQIENRHLPKPWRSQ